MQNHFSIGGSCITTTTPTPHQHCKSSIQMQGRGRVFHLHSHCLRDVEADVPDVTNVGVDAPGSSVLICHQVS